MTTQQQSSRGWRLLALSIDLVLACVVGVALVFIGVVITTVQLILANPPEGIQVTQGDFTASVVFLALPMTGLAELWGGRSLGKRLARCRIASVSTHRLRERRAARWLIKFGLFLALFGYRISELEAHWRVPTQLAVLLVMALFIHVVWSAMTGKPTLSDRLTGTRVVRLADTRAAE